MLPHPLLVVRLALFTLILAGSASSRTYADDELPATSSPIALTPVTAPAKPVEFDGSVFLRGKGRLDFTLPDNLAPGRYWVEFAGARPGPIIEWVSGLELEPFRFLVGKTARSLEVRAFAFEVDPAAPRRSVDAVRHPQFDQPFALTTLRSDQPLELTPGQMLALEVRIDWSLVGEVRLVPAASIGEVTLTTDTDVPYHFFSDARPPAFHLKAESTLTKPFAGNITLRWLDAIEGVVQTETLAVAVASGKPFETTHAPAKPLAYGAYTLHVELTDDTGRVVTRQQRHFTHSPNFADVASLPDSWPLGWHNRGEPGIPEVGFKWIRLFTSWDELEPKQGEFNWTKLDAIIAKARERGQKVMWIAAGAPRWASRNPDGAKSQDLRNGKPPYWQYPPRDWSDLDRFVTAVWERYAPGGDTSVLAAVEVNNEPNVAVSVWPETMSFADYAKYCETVYKATKRVAPSAKVVGVCQSGGLHKWWIDGVLDAGAGKWLDVLSTHNYELGQPVGAVSIASKIAATREAAKRNGLDVPVWNTEVGVGSLGRWGGQITPDDVLEKRARSSPKFDPRLPNKIGQSWRSTNEYVASGEMIRMFSQHVELGAAPAFIFKWHAGGWSWVHDDEPNGNVLPKLYTPVLATFANLYRRYGMEALDPIQLVSPDPAYVLFAHRFRGPAGRMTVLYAYPDPGKELVTTDDMLGQAFIPPGVRWAGEIVKLPGADGQLPPPPQPFTKELLTVKIPDLRPGAVATDILVRHRSPVSADQAIPVRQMPTYIIEPADGAPVWPATK